MKDDFIAKLEFLSTENGGRSHYAKSGYRPHIEFDEIKGLLTSGQQTYIGQESASPGETVEASILTIMSKYLTGMLEEGDKFSFSEGPRPIGKGVIKIILKSQLTLSNIPKGIITIDTINQFEKETKTPRELKTPTDYLNHIIEASEVMHKMEQNEAYKIKLNKLIDKLSYSKEVKEKIQHITHR
tara:strand:- start:121 stop:675 length:555 start_codon:yes stop_codon:yes gene_type:complete